MTIPIPTNEAERLSFLNDMRLDASLPFDEIQGLCDVASRLVGAPIALVTLIDEDQQEILANIGAEGLGTTSREASFCTHAIMDSEQFEVADTQLDPRFSENPFVVGDPNIRSYLGTVLEPAPEMRLGTLCVFDTKTRTYTAQEKAFLAKIGKAISALLIAHRDNLELADYSNEVTVKNAKLAELTASLQHSLEKLVEAENVKNEFLSVVSHELRTPLTSIMGALGLMNERFRTDEPQRTQRLISIATQNSGRLLSLVNDILNLQRNEFSNREVKLVPVDLNEMIETSAEAYQNYGADLDVTLTVSGAGQPCYVRGDKHLLDRVIANILSNAFKFSKTGGNVEISLRDVDNQPQISVKDNGAGIPEGSKEKVFGLFSQVDSSDSRAAQRGTGLGMYICQNILKQHNATIDYESEVGVGTTFVVTFNRPFI
ncbi:signal transduction histidine kinase [Loktanella ponticola]|uniref:histidine kinase n=1 Tax=Yoonia ponticola TaxID=1524255 RepID=A0A7W9BKS2_9RHOB|nr:GAF domain-containing sensor histidine kinase [Yoonia ponticola]MBB5722265.1 signal transduction histidine kinase [Yoonia ponticola]